MNNPNNDVDVNALIKIYNQKIATLTNQNIILEAKLNTLQQDFFDDLKLIKLVEWVEQDLSEVICMSTYNQYKDSVSAWNFLNGKK